MVVAKPTDLRLDETYMKTSVILAILRGKTTVQGASLLTDLPTVQLRKTTNGVPYPCIYCLNNASNTMLHL